MLPPPHNEYILAAGDALDFIGNMVREPLLQLQPVGELVGDACRASATELADLKRGISERCRWISCWPYGRRWNGASGGGR